LVEVAGRYSNLCDQGERIQDLLEMVPAGPKRAKVRTPRPDIPHIGRGQFTNYGRSPSGGVLSERDIEKAEQALL
jgi:hypothetical protein